MTGVIPHGGWEIFACYAWLGLAAALPIGPVNVEIARRTLRGGFWAGFALGCGAVTVDITYSVLSSLSLARLVTRSWVQWPVGVGGFLLLVYLGVQSLRSAQNPPDAQVVSPAAGAVAVGGSYRTGVLMTLLNPITLIFWFVEIPAQGAITQGRLHNVPMMMAGVFIGTFGWVVGFCSFLTWIGQWRRGWWLVAADRLGGVMLLGLACYGLWHLIALTL